MTILKHIGQTALVQIEADDVGADAATLANDLIGLAWEHEADVVAIAVDVLPAAFLELSAGLIGEVAQKFATYRLQLVVVGDISDQTAQSKSLRDYVYETNTGGTVWFVTDTQALHARLAQKG